MSRILVVYYSVSNGNTREIAHQMAEYIKADLAEIQTVQPYDGSYQEVVNQGKQEVQRSYHPSIRPLPFRPEDYDIIAIGTPTWWYTMVPAMATFLSLHEWAGKTVIPFQTHGGWPGHTLKDIKAACKGAKFCCEGQIQFDSSGGSQMVTDEKEVQHWLQQIKKKVEII